MSVVHVLAVDDDPQAVREVGVHLDGGGVTDRVARGIQQATGQVVGV